MVKIKRSFTTLLKWQRAITGFVDTITCQKTLQVLLVVLPFAGFIVITLFMFPKEMSQDFGVMSIWRYWEISTWFFLLVGLLLLLLGQWRMNFSLIWISLGLFFLIEGSAIYYGFTSFADGGMVSFPGIMVCLVILTIWIVLRFNYKHDVSQFILPLVAYLFMVCFFNVFSHDFVSFGGVHVDFYDPFPFMRQALLSLGILHFVFLPLFLFIKKWYWWIVVVSLFIFGHLVAWNYPTLGSILYYTDYLRLRRTAIVYLGLIFSAHFRFILIDSLLFIPLLVIFLMGPGWWAIRHIRRIRKSPRPE